ncbi:MAG: DUF962 domain-containing protein [Alphaproteobacteria bacterium]|nr:DUF962 domain-containing protein [Alphaproteobacteria bacterium]
MATDRFETFAEFWPHYLGEHRTPLCRVAHFVGTSISIALYAASFALDPVGFGGAMLFVVALGAAGFSVVESRARATVFLLAMFGVAAWAQPYLVPAAVAAGYAFAWVGHFHIENNRPASFDYPVWSFFADLRMWALMLTGRLWSGDPVTQVA